MIALALTLAVAAGQVSYETVTLPEVISRSEIIVTIRLDKPASTSVKLPIPTSGTKACGTYDYGVYTGTIVSLVHPTERELTPVQPGERIVVFLGNTPELLSLSALACETGISESPIFETFKAGATPKDGATMTAFLRWANGVGWVEAVSGAWVAKPPAAATLANARGRAAFDIKERSKDNALCVVDADCTRSEIASCNVCAPCTNAGNAMAKSAASRFRADCVHSLGNPPSPCGPCMAPNMPKAVCREMKCVDAPK